VDLAGSLDPANVSATLDAAGMGLEQGRALVARLVETQARTLALDNVFVVAAIIQVLASVAIWFAPRVRPPGAAARK